MAVMDPILESSSNFPTQLPLGQREGLLDNTDGTFAERTRDSGKITPTADAILDVYLHIKVRRDGGKSH